MKKILLVEDHEDLLASTSEMLALKGFEVMTAENGKKGFALAKKSPPDLIISDIMMPKMDGYEMLITLRSDAKTAMIPFVFLTASAQKSDILRGAFSGADRYLTKPFTIAELLKTIQEIMDVLPERV